MPEICERTSNSELEAQVYYNKYYAFTKNPISKGSDNYLIHDSLQEIIYNLIKTG